VNTARAQARALLVARVLVGVYLLEILLNLSRPRLVEHEPSLTIFATADDTTAPVRNLFSLPETIFWILVVGVAVGLVLQIVAVRFPADSRQARLLTWATLAVLLLPFGLLPLYFMERAPLVVLACIPTTVIALVALYCVQLFGRLPIRLLVLAFAWGALISSGFFRACANLTMGTAGGYLLKSRMDNSGDLGAFTTASTRMLDVTLITGGVVMAVAQAGGVLILLLLVPHRLRDVVSGTVLGAAAGLGFAFSDSVVLIKLLPLLDLVSGSTSGFEYWVQQILTLFAGSLAFGAVLGGAMAVAIRQTERRPQILIGAAGLSAAAGGWVASQKLSGWLQATVFSGVDQGSALDTLIISPLAVLLFQVPFVVIYVLLLRFGLRERSARIRSVPAETLAPAVSPLEARVMADPAVRFWSLVTTFRRLGRPAAVALFRLQEAQLALAGHRADPDLDPMEEETLRDNVFRLKSALPTDARAARS
jgi:RsiW-degrading membrane proteinase PrsW (M82 family)